MTHVNIKFNMCTVFVWRRAHCAHALCTSHTGAKPRAHVTTALISAVLCTGQRVQQHGPVYLGRVSQVAPKIMGETCFHFHQAKTFSRSRFRKLAKRQQRFYKNWFNLGRIVYFYSL
jgi:hypothetical protein